MSARVFGMLPACAILAACNVAPVTAPVVKALIVDPDEESRRELQQTVSTALNGADITLAEDALTHDSLLNIEHRARPDMRERPLRGRDVGSPEQFQLVLDGRQCMLVQRSTGLRWLLLDTECVAE